MEERYVNRALLTTYQSIDALDVLSTTPAAKLINNARLCATDNNNNTVNMEKTGVEISLRGGNLFDKFNPGRLVLAVGIGADVSNLFHMDTAPTSTALTMTPYLVKTNAVDSTALAESSCSIGLLRNCQSGNVGNND